MAMSILASVLGFHGRRPEVPPFVPIDTTKEQEKALSGNISNFGAATELAGKTNAFNQQQILQMLQNAIPGYNAIQQKSSNILQSQLAGEIPTDVTQQVQNLSAGRALAGGYGGGSGMGRSLTARDLGLTSLDITNRALASAGSWLTQTRNLTMPELFTPQSMFISPAQRIQTQMWNTSNAWNAQWLANQVKAMPSPEQAAYGGFMDWIAGLGESATTMGIGGGMGGGGGGGGGLMSMFGGGGGGSGGGGQPPNYNVLAGSGWNAGNIP